MTTLPTDQSTKIPILFIDDETELLEVYQELFEEEGFEVNIAGSGLEGLEFYKNNQNIRLIISDFNMGDISGFQLLEILKKTYEKIPLFYLLTGDHDQSEENIKAKGGHGVILKPFELDNVILKIKKDLNLL